MTTDEPNDGLVRMVAIVLGILVLLPLVMMAFAMPMMGMVGWSWGHGVDGPVAPLWVLGMGLVWLVVLIGVGYLLYRGLVGGRMDTVVDPALEELRLAYARGDLSEEEFEQRRSTLLDEE